jgi:hypothetical protein
LKEALAMCTDLIGEFAAFWFKQYPTPEKLKSPESRASLRVRDLINLLTSGHIECKHAVVRRLLDGLGLTHKPSFDYVAALVIMTQNRRLEYDHWSTDQEDCTIKKTRKGYSGGLQRAIISESLKQAWADGEIVGTVPRG